MLGHEVVHAAARHTAQAQTRGRLLQGALLGSMIGAQGGDYANLILVGASLGAQLITQRFGGEVGKRAAVAYTRLDMQDNPAAYFRVRSAADNKGRLLAQVTNASVVDADSVQIEFRILISGRVESGVQRIGSLAAGESRVVDAGVRLPAEVVGDPRKYDARVIAARVK